MLYPLINDPHLINDPVAQAFLLALRLRQKGLCAVLGRATNVQTHLHSIQCQRRT
jgi:hypothetical protein